MTTARLHNLARESKCSLKKTGKGSLAVTKAITVGASNLFGLQAAVAYYTANKDLSAMPNITISVFFAFITLAYNAGTRSVQMIQPRKQIPSPTSSPTESLPTTIKEEKRYFYQVPSDYSYLSKRYKRLYGTAMFLSEGSKLFTALAAYNGAFNLCKTLVRLSSSSDQEPIDIINSDLFGKELPIQLFSIFCFAAQLLSFHVFQSRTLQEYLLKWWFDPTERNEQIYKQGYVNFLLLFIFFTIIASTTFFTFFSTEAGLNNLNKSLFRSALPEIFLNVLEIISTICACVLTYANAVPAIYNYLSNKKSSEKSLTSSGKFFLILGMIDTLISTLITIYSSIYTLSLLIDIDEYNPILMGLTIPLITITNIPYNFTYNTYKPIRDLYSELDAPLLNQASSDGLHSSESETNLFAIYDEIVRNNSNGYAPSVRNNISIYGSRSSGLFNDGGLSIFAKPSSECPRIVVSTDSTTDSVYELNTQYSPTVDWARDLSFT